MTFNDFPYSDFHQLNLDWVIRTMRELQNKFPGEIAAIANALAALSPRVDTLENEVGELSTGGLLENLREVLAVYMPAMIYPEISDSGYIVYNIPGGWDAITFNTTGVDIALELQPEYGHLVLSY